MEEPSQAVSMAELLLLGVGGFLTLAVAAFLLTFFIRQQRRERSR